MTNDPLIKQRVERCEAALTDYSDEDRFTCLIDLMADAMHWCDASREDFGYALAQAGRHYIQERNDETADERRIP
jgi:hypothetical protein